MNTEQTIKLASLEQRKKDCAKIMSIYPNKIPVVIDKNPNFPNSVNITKNKLIISEDFTVSELLKTIIQKYLPINSEQDITLYVTPANIPISASGDMKTFYKTYKDEDGFLYLKYSTKTSSSGSDKDFKIIILKHPEYLNAKTLTKTEFTVSKNIKVSTFLETVIKPEITKFTYPVLKIEDLKLYVKNQNAYLPIKGEENLINYEKDKTLYYSYIREKHYEDNPLSFRKKEFENLKNAYPYKVPTILEKDPNVYMSKEIAKYKYLLPQDLSLSKMKETLQKEYHLQSLTAEEKENFTLKPKIGGPVNMEKTLEELPKNKDDGFLYLLYSYKAKKKYSMDSLGEDDEDSMKDKLSDEDDYSKSGEDEKIEIILEKDPNYPDIKSLTNNKYTFEKDLKVFEFEDMVKKDLDLKPVVDGKGLYFNITQNALDAPLTSNENVSFFFHDYKEEEGYVKLYYLYKYLDKIDLPLETPTNKSLLKLEERKEKAKNILANNKIPVSIEKHPKSFMESINKSYELSNELTISKLQIMIKTELCLKGVSSNVRFCLITDTNIDLRPYQNASIQEVYEKYKDEDNNLYIFYIDPSFLPEPVIIKKFKEIYNLEERKNKYKELREKHPSDIFIKVEASKNEIPIQDIIICKSNEEIDSLKIKIWKKIGKPLQIIQLLTENKIAVKKYTKVSDLYHDVKDKEDQFLYLYYKTNKPDFEIDKKENLTDARKIFLLFKRIPFVLKPSNQFKNSGNKYKVYLPFKSKQSVFKELLTNKNYAFYNTLINSGVSPEEKIVDYYMKNRNINDDFLYLEIGKA